MELTRPQILGMFHVAMEVSIDATFDLIQDGSGGDYLLKTNSGFGEATYSLPVLGGHDVMTTSIIAPTQETVGPEDDLAL